MSEIVQKKLEERRAEKFKEQQPDLTYLIIATMSWLAAAAVAVPVAVTKGILTVRSRRGKKDSESDRLVVWNARAAAAAATPQNG